MSMVKSNFPYERAKEIHWRGLKKSEDIWDCYMRDFDSWEVAMQRFDFSLTDEDEWCIGTGRVMHVWHMILEEVSNLTRPGVWVGFFNEHNVDPSSGLNAR